MMGSFASELTTLTTTPSTAAAPLGAGEELFYTILQYALVGLFNLFSNVLLDLISVFLFFPDPGNFFGINEIWQTSLSAFVVVWTLAAFVYLLSLEVFPYNENLAPWRFIERSLIAAIAIIVSRPGLSFIIELVNLVSRYIYPQDFAIVFTGSGFESYIGGITGGLLAYFLSLVAMYSGGIITIGIFLAILSVRAMIVYTVYATFPIWMAFWIVDAGPLKYGHEVSQFIFRAFAMLLGAGILISAILATGAGIATYDPSSNPADTATISNSDTYIDSKHLSAYDSPDNVAGAQQDNLRTGFAVKLIAFFGSLWAAVALTGTFLGMVVTAGGSAAARSGGRAGRAMPGGGGGTVTDPGGSASGAMGTDGAAPRSMPGSHGGGPGESSSFLTKNDIPFQQQRSLTSQAKGAFNTLRSGGFSPGGMISGGGDGLKKRALGSAQSGAKRFDSFAEGLSNAGNKSVLRGMKDGAQHLRENPVVGEKPNAAEMLHNQGAGFVQTTANGPSVPGNFGSVSEYHHPDTAKGWTRAGEQEALGRSGEETFRGHRTGYKDPLIVSDVESGVGADIEMQRHVRSTLSQSANLSTNSPYATYDPDSGVAVVEEKQGRSLDEITADDEMSIDEIDKETFVDNVTASVITGDMRGAKGEFLYDHNGEAFNPRVDSEIRHMKEENFDSFIEKAGEKGIASSEEIRENLDQTLENIQREHSPGEHSEGPYDDISGWNKVGAHKAATGQKYNPRRGSPMNPRAEAIRDNYRVAHRMKEQRKTK